MIFKYGGVSTLKLVATKKGKKIGQNLISDRRFESTLVLQKRQNIRVKYGAVMMFKYGKRFGFAPSFNN